MEPTTFYYTLSTIPQILAALTAVLAVFLFRRFELLETNLWGLGKSIYDRSKAEEYNFLFPNNLKEKNKQDLRLRDAINKKSFAGIKTVIEFFKNAETTAEKNRIPVNKDKGLTFVYFQYCAIENKIKELKKWSKFSLAFSIIGILLSVICLSLTDIIFKHCLSIFILIINLIVFIISLIFILYVVFISFKSEKQ